MRKIIALVPVILFSFTSFASLPTEQEGPGQTPVLYEGPGQSPIVCENEEGLFNIKVIKKEQVPICGEGQEHKVAVETQEMLEKRYYENLNLFSEVENEAQYELLKEVAMDKACSLGPMAETTITGPMSETKICADLVATIIYQEGNPPIDIPLEKPHAPYNY